MGASVISPGASMPSTMGSWPRFASACSAWTAIGVMLTGLRYGVHSAIDRP